MHIIQNEDDYTQSQCQLLLVCLCFRSALRVLSFNVCFRVTDTSFVLLASAVMTDPFELEGD